MVRPISEDLRLRAVAAVGAGASCREAARRFGVGASSVIRWVERHRQTGSVAAKPMGGHRKHRIVDDHRGWLLARIAAEHDLTLEEMRRELAGRGLVVGYGTVWRFCAHERLSFKKNRARHPAGPA